MVEKLATGSESLSMSDGLHRSETVVRPTVVVDDERADSKDHLPVDTERWKTLLLDVLVAEGFQRRPVEVHVHFVDEQPMEDLNRTYMDDVGSTDVLSFPVDDPSEVPIELPVLLGDIFLCPVVAHRQAPGHTGDYLTEVALLLVHGLLHLLGHEHSEPGEEAIMRASETEHLKRHGMTRP